MIGELIRYLGLRESPGWVDASLFDETEGPRGALRRARDEMGVKGAFGTWQYGASPGERKRFVPLLYVAEAADELAARDQVHRRVWSQGLVPLLIICTPESVFINEGYAFSREHWARQVARVPARSLLDGGGALACAPLERLRPQRLMSSTAWRDFAVNPSARVDNRLLAALEALSVRLSRHSNAPAQAANALIGRFLYFYILRDRALLSDAWMAQFGASDAFETRSPQLTIDLVWKVFGELDEWLNGTIFPMRDEHRRLFGDDDVRLLRDCIKLGDTLDASGVQLSFVDFDISSLQTETLSAIYEQFLETEDSTGKRREGAFYTPPFLADFVLDRVEEEIPLVPGCRIIDCTAGSGVFIVSAYRRVIEHALASSGGKTLPAARLRQLLLESIFGIEKSPSAHAVAAFSLYLTMLDYVEPGDIERCLTGQEATPLFPSLRTHNVICADAFSIAAPATTVTKFDVVIGNPPWQSIDRITDRADEVRDAFGDRVDSGEAAEYTVWWAARHLAEPDGVIALVMPTKSLVGPSAKRFPSAVARELDVLGVVSFAHFRYQLFAHARQAACAVFLRNRAPSGDARLWSYAPTRAHMPGPTSSGPWMLALDRAQVQYTRQLELKSDDAWFQMLMLRPLDRHIRRYLADRVAIGRTLDLKTLFAREGIALHRGGSPAQTGLAPHLLFGADKFKDNDIRYAPGVTLLRDAGQKALFSAAETADGANSRWLTRVRPEFAQRFSGDALIIPRSMQGLAFAAAPVAFNSSVNAAYFVMPAATSVERTLRAQLLKAIGTFLESEVGLYLTALTGRLWMLDRTRLEKNDLLALPVPFEGRDDPFVRAYLDSSESERTALVCRQWAFPDWLIAAVQEYGAFRRGFEDGGVPGSFGAMPSAEDLSRYKDVLSETLRPISAGFERPCIEVDETADAARPYAVTIFLEPAQTSLRRPGAETAAPTRSGSAIASFNDSAWLSASPDESIAMLRKPAERFCWTIESAFMDGARIMHRMMLNQQDFVSQHG